jgi:four helix bundle protein
MSNNLYRNLLVWQKSVSLIKEVYAQADKLPKSEEYNLKQQLKRAVVSVALNIAEGKNRKSSKEFINFLNISCGSLAETESILIICNELEFIPLSEKTMQNIEELAKMLNSLIGHIKSKQSTNK